MSRVAAVSATYCVSASVLLFALFYENRCFFVVSNNDVLRFPFFPLRWDVQNVVVFRRHDAHRQCRSNAMRRQPVFGGSMLHNGYVNNTPHVAMCLSFIFTKYVDFDCFCFISVPYLSLLLVFHFVFCIFFFPARFVLLLLFCSAAMRQFHGM